MLLDLFCLMDRFALQCGHLVAASAISDLQKGQVLVVGALGGSSLWMRDIAVFITLTSRKTIRAMIRKLTTAVINLP